MGIEESIKIYGAKIDELLKEIIPPHRNDYLSEPIWHHLHTGGKRVRPAICLITCDYCFMDTENYEQVLLPKEAVEDAIPYMTLNSQAKIAFYEGKALSVELPTSVSLKIIETDPGMKGDTVVNVYKPAKLETGLVVKVPLFINNGEVIKVDTRTGEFLGRE